MFNKCSDLDVNYLTKIFPNFLKGNYFRYQFIFLLVGYVRHVLYYFSDHRNVSFAFNENKLYIFLSWRKCFRRAIDQTGIFRLQDGTTCPHQ